jgi:hypothetical protein
LGFKKAVPRKLFRGTIRLTHILARKRLLRLDLKNTWTGIIGILDHGGSEIKLPVGYGFFNGGRFLSGFVEFDFGNWGADFVL